MEEIQYIKYIKDDGNLIECPIYNKEIINLTSIFKISDYKPISIEEIIKQRVRKFSDKKLSKRWWLNNFNSFDSIMYHPNGRIKIVHNSQTLMDITDKKTIDNNGSLILKEGTFDKIKGEEFSKKEVKKYTNKSLKLNEILDNPVWPAFLKGNQDLFKEYILQVYSRFENSQVMKIFVQEEIPKYETERFLCLLGTNSNCSISGNQSGRLDQKKIRMVGISTNEFL